jgi:hypothetical protein
MKRARFFTALTLVILMNFTTVKAQKSDKKNDLTTTIPMNKKDFTTALLVDQSPKEVFNVINNVRGWWQGEIEGSTDKINDEFTYRMEEIHFSKQKVVEVIPNKKIVWLVTDSKLSFTKNKSEWTGTKIIFEISEINNKTQLRFTHMGLIPEFECYGGCSNAWEDLIQESLFSLITTGKGKKVF